MTTGTEIEINTETPREFLRRMGVEVDVTDHRPIGEIARIFGHIAASNLDTGSEASD